MPLSGIVPGGGEGQLDYDVVSVSLAEEAFYITNPLVVTIAGCSSGLETPISMRNLLGGELCFDGIHATTMYECNSHTFIYSLFMYVIHQHRSWRIHTEIYA